MRQKPAVRRLSAACGGVVTGIDLANLDDQTFAFIRAALDEHLVLFFPEQHTLSPQSHAAFAKRFGELEVHPHADKYNDELPEVCVLNSERGGRADVWHTDVTYTEKPPIAACVRYMKGPDVGGDTQWANMYLAYEKLSQPMREMLDGMTALHSSTIDPSMNFEHPAIRVHPNTGKRSLYVNRLFTSSLRQLKPDESRALLNYLHDYQERPEFTCRWRWSPGDVAIWDNRCTLHYAINDYDSERELHRCIVLGDKPEGNAGRWTLPERQKAASSVGYASRTGEPRDWLQTQ